MTRRDELEARLDMHRRDVLGWLNVLSRTDRDTRRYDAKLSEVAVGIRVIVALRRVLALDDLELAAVADVEQRLVEEGLRVSHDDAVREVARLRGWSGVEAVPV